MPQGCNDLQTGPLSLLEWVPLKICPTSHTGWMVRIFHRFTLILFQYKGSIAFCVGKEILVDDDNDNNSYELLSSYYNYVGHSAQSILCRLPISLIFFAVAL